MYKFVVNENFAPRARKAVHNMFYTLK